MRRCRRTGLHPHCPPLQGSPEKRLSDFVALGRASRRHGRASAFEAAIWDVTNDVARRSGVPARPGPLRISFGVTDAGSRELALFLRAYVGPLPRAGHSQLQTVVLAGGLIAGAMRDAGLATVAGITVATLNAASALAQARHSPAHAARLGRAVRSLGGFLHAQGMTRAPLEGAIRPTTPEPVPDRADAAFAARSRRLLPSERFLVALADAHRLATEPADIIVTRVMAILMSAPGRINEALALEEDPEVEREVDGVAVLGLRWRGSKGAADGVKWVAPEMVATVRTGCEDLHRVTAEGRRIKTWYDRNPTSLYLPPPLAGLRGKARLTARECGTLLGRHPGPGLHRHVAKLGIAQLPPLPGLMGAAHNVTFADIETHLLELLPGRMRDAGGPRTHPLLVVPWGAFDRARRSPCPTMFETVHYRHIASALGGPRGRPGSLFRRLGLDPGGEIRGRTHSLRHWLTTLSLRGGLTAAEVATWLGRVSPREIRAYDHRTADEMRSAVSRLSAASRRTTSPLARTPPGTLGDGVQGSQTAPSRPELTG